MPSLTRRRDPDARQERWRVYYGDVRVGTIGMRSGVPVTVDQWCWSVGFYPMSHRGEREDGTAPDFSKARAGFDVAWSRLLPKITETELAEHRQERAWNEWKYRMWDCGCKLPTQEADGVSLCFCGAEVDIPGMLQHVYDE